MCTVDNRYTGFLQNSICHRFCIFCDNITVIADFKCNTYRRIVILCSFCQCVLSGCQISKYFCCAISCPAFLFTIRLFQSQLIAGHCLAVYICFCKGQFHILIIGICDGLRARNTNIHGNHVAAGIACDKGLIADLSCAAIFHAVAFCVQFKDVVSLAAVQSVKGNRLFALVAGCNGNGFLLSGNFLIVAVCVLRKQSYLNCMVNCRIAVLGCNLRYCDLGRIVGGVCDNGACVGSILGQGERRNLTVLITAVIRNVECRICFCSGILGVENNRHLERSTVFDTLVTVHFENVVRSICVQTVKGHIRTGSDFLSCADLCVIVSVLGEQSHGEYGCALDIICDQHLADGDAVLGLFKVSDCSSTACLYCRRCCRSGGVADTAVRSVAAEVCICQNAVGIGFQHVEIHALGHTFKYHVVRACLGKGPGLHRCFLIANILACRILGEQGKIEGVAGDVFACQSFGQCDLTCIFGVGYADSLIRCDISGDRIAGICRCVVANLIALGICFQQVNVVGVVGLLLDRGQVYVLHGDGSRGLSCRNGDGNHIAQPCGVIFIGKQCKIERCVLGFCCCQGLVDRHINGGVRCLYPDADLCRLCYHDSIAQNVRILIGVREAVPCDVFLAGLCHIAGNGCGNFDNNFVANLDGRILQLDTEVDGIVRLDVCPVHDIVLPQPVLGVLIQDRGLVGGIATCCFINYICSAYHNRINALEFHAKGGISGISGNQTQVSHIGQTVDNGHVFQIYRRVVLDMEFIGHIFTLHALHIVVGGLAAVTGIISRIGVRVAGVSIMSIIGIRNGLPRFGGQTNDIVVCIVPDLRVALFASNRILCGERLFHFCIASVGDNAFFFLAVFYSGGELYDDGIVRLQFSFCNACSCHTGNIPADRITVGSGFDRCTIISGNHTIFVHSKAAVCIQRHYKIFCRVAGVVKFIAAGKIICQRHVSEIQPAQFFPVQGSLASGICFALAVIEDCLPDQGIAGSDIAVFHLLEICVLIVLSGIGSHCQLGEAGGGSGFGEADVHLILRRDHTITAVIFALHHCHLGKGVCQCDFFRRAVCQFLCLVGGQLGLVSQLYATAPLICKFFCGNKCKGQRLSNSSCLNATQSCIICSSLYTIWHIFHAVRQRIFYNDRFPSIVII